MGVPGKMYAATIIPARNVKMATRPLRLRLTKEQLAAGATVPDSPHRVKGQRVRVFDDRDAALEWLEKNSTDEDQLTLRRWKPRRASGR